MSQKLRLLLLFFLVGIIIPAGYYGFNRQVGASLPADQNQSSGDLANDSIRSNTVRDFGSLPLYFTVNRGQAGENVKYYSVGSRYGLFLTQNGATMRLVAENSVESEIKSAASFEKSKTFSTDQIHLNFIGADLSVPPEGEDELSGQVNYLVGNQPARWHTNLSTFAKVKYKGIYPGVDVVFYGNQRELEYDVVVAPQANPSRVALSFDGAQKVSVNKNGELVLKLSSGEIVQRKPVAYQNINGERREVAVRFNKRGGKRIAFRLGKYDRESQLIIDPTIVFSTFFGGSSTDVATAVKTDAAGNIYLTGATVSPNFPTVNPAQPTFGGSFNYDAFVTKINPTGNAVIYSTYLGGASEDYARSINVDANGNAVVTGRTYSENFPTVNALQTQIGGSADGFIAKLNSTGSALIYSTFLGGSAFEDILGATLDADGNPLVVGRTDSGDFPTVNPYQAKRAGISFFRSDNSGSSFMSGEIAPPITTVSTFAVNPNSADTVFAGTNIGVFRSDDGGKTWTAAGKSDLFGQVSKIAVAPSNSGVVYAVSNGIIYKSTNNGNNWTNILGNLPALFNTIAIDPSNAEIVYAAGFGAIYKSVNGGASWTNISIVNNSSTVYSLAIDPNNPQIVYAGTSQRIYKSTVGGGSWTALTNGFQVTTTIWDLLIDSGSHAIYAATQNGLYKSTDAGASFTTINAGNTFFAVRSIAKDPNNSAIFFAVTSYGLFYRSLDGGSTWNEVNGGLPGSVLYAVAVSSNSVLLGGYAGTDAFVSRLSGNGSSLTFSTFFGGDLNDTATGVQVDAAGRITLVGVTNSPNFPTSNAFQPVLGGGNDAFAAKFNRNGTSLVFSTFLGGEFADSAASVAVDNVGNAYLTGSTVSENFPVKNALQSACNSCNNFNNDAFVTKLNSENGTIVYSSFLGGNSADNGLSIAVDSQNQAYVSGSTSSNNFPVLDAVQPAFAGGTDGFVGKIKADGNDFIYSTYYGGSSNDVINGINIAPEGNAVIVGQTSSSNFPLVQPIQSTIGGGQDIFIAKIGVAADLQITIADDRDPVMINNPLVYNLIVKNNGVSAATNVVVTDVLPAGVSYVSAAPTTGSCAVNDSTLTCNLGNLARNEQAAVRLVLTPTQAGTIINTVSVKANEPDPNADNNSASQSTLISLLPSIGGKITTENGQPASAVNVGIQGFQNRTVQTDAAGKYLAAELPFGGNYTVRPNKPGFYFSPRSKTFDNLTSDGTADFVVKVCTYTLSTNSVNVSAAGGEQNIFITTNDPYCSWTVTNNNPWISVVGESSGFGNGTVKLSIQPSSLQRTGTLIIAGQTFTVTQSGCSYQLTPLQQSFSRYGGSGTIAVIASQSFCRWNAAAAQSWLTITNGLSGTGSGTVNYAVTPTSRPRSGQIIVAGQIFTIYQEFNRCENPTFGTPFESTVNSDSLDIVTADFNKDGIPDLATVDITANQSATYSEYIGNGAGRFSRNSIATTIGPLAALTVGDFNGDSNSDLALAGSGKVAVYTGAGNGAITLLTTFNANSGTYSKIFTADFNRDGKPDLLVSSLYGINFYNGNGDGTFREGASYPVGGRFYPSVAVGDINGDGITDFIVGASEEDFSTYRLIYYFGATDGTFTQSGIISLGTTAPSVLKIGDFNGDGRADIVTNGSGGSQIQVFLWNPDANGFKPPLKVFTEPYVGYNFGIADFNNDGKQDNITTTADYGPPRINILRGQGDGKFLPFISSPSVNRITAMTFADFNRDGKTDVAFSTYSTQLAAQLNQCATVYNQRTAFDFDGDGKADISVYRSDSGVWYLLNSQSGFTAAQFGISSDKLVPADYDGDGITDLAVYRAGTWYLQRSTAGFTGIVFGEADDIPVPADFDGDGKAELVVWRPSNGSWYVYNLAANSFTTVQFGISTDKPVPADYNGDGRADYAVFRPSNGTWYIARPTVNPSQNFDAIQFGETADKPVPADYDGDGKTDVAVYRPSNGTWYLSRSSQGFTGVQFGISTDLPAPADYDGDGKTDIAVFRSGTWYLRQSTNGFTGIQFGVGTDRPIENVFVP